MKGGEYRCVREWCHDTLKLMRKNNTPSATVPLDSRVGRALVRACMGRVLDDLKAVTIGQDELAQFHGCYKWNPCTACCEASTNCADGAAGGAPGHGANLGLKRGTGKGKGATASGGSRA